MADNTKITNKKLPVIILSIALVCALIFGCVSNNQKLEAQNNVTTITAEKTDAQNKLAETEAAKTEAEAKLAETEAAKADAEAKLAETEAAKAEAETKLAETEAAKAEVEGKLAETEAAKAEVEGKLTEAEAAKAEAEAKAADLEAQVAAAAVTEEPGTALAGKVIILHTNDIHGRGVAGDDAFGYARIAQMKKNLQAQGAYVLLVDAGDFSQGTPLVNLGNGKNTVQFMNAAGYDAVTVGNHEFDWGTDNLQTILGDANYKVLCANLTRTADGTLVFEGNVIFETPVGKIGVFGLATPETMTKAHPDKVKGVTFSMTDALYADAQKQVDELKANGCEYIICLGHLGDSDESMGNRSIDVLAKVTGIDLFIDGHSHTTIDGGVKEGETLRVSTGEYSGAIGYVVIEKVTEDDKTSFTTTAGLYTLADDAEAKLALGEGLTEDAATAEVVNTINAQVEEELSATFATTTVLLDGNRDPGVRTQETNLGDFAADAILWAAKQALGEDKVDAAITNGGGIRASIEVGDVTMKTMKTVFPFGNEVATLTVTGAELLEAIEAATWSTPTAIGAFPQVAGIEFVIDTTVPYVNGELYPDSTYYAPANPGARVTILTVGGKPWAADATYVIATNDFTAAGGDTYYVFKYPFQQTGYKTGVALEDALVNYTAAVLNGQIGEQYAAPAGRITIK